MLSTIKKIYHQSPAEWLSALSEKLQNLTQINSERTATILDSTYFAWRDQFLQILIEKVRQGEDIYDVLTGFNGKQFDERVVEYPYLVHWILEQEKGLDILDVGSVLNNKLVSKTLIERCNRVWLCNPVIEKKVYIQNPLYYHISDLENSFPCGEQFPLVTCLSTIEVGVSLFL